MNDERERLKAYLQDRFAREDWHGVSDAANDLRELDAEMRGAASMVADDCFPQEPPKAVGDMIDTRLFIRPKKP